MTGHVSVSHILRSIALAVALLIQTSAPVAFVWHASHDDQQSLAFKARISAGRAAKYILRNLEMWEFHAMRLTEVIEYPGIDATAVRQSILTKDGRVVMAESAELEWPVISHREPLVVGGQPIGTLLIETSARPTLNHAILVTLAAFVLAVVSFFALHRWPLRMLDRAISRLKAEQARTECALNQLQIADDSLRDRTEQLLAAQKIGRLGDWSLDVETNTPFLSSEMLGLLQIEQAGESPSIDFLLERGVGDSSARMQALVASVIKTGIDGAIDVQVRRTDNSIADFAITCQVASRKGDRVTRLRGIIQDVSERKTAERQLERLAYFDPLTGLANRSLFQRELRKAVQRARSHDMPAALLLIDLDRFKEVNDSLGHGYGDELLVRVSRLLSQTVPPDQFIARLGGDEFAIILSDISGRAQIAALAETIIDLINKPVQIKRSEALIGASIGIALLPDHGANAEDLIKNADLALYRAKDAGRGRHMFFEPEMDALMQQKMALARDLRAAATNDDGLEVWLQPQVSMADHRIVGFEALMRWNHPTRGYIPPTEFIPIAESSSLISDVGLWILKESAHMAKAWIDAGGEPYEVAVNLSAAQIWQTNIEQDVATVLRESGLPPHLLCLELTESLLADHAEGRVRNTLTRLKALGVKLALDDFGTGFSSLGYLIQLPFDKLKIDRIFVSQAPRSDKARHVLEGIIALGHGLGMRVLAEGVETPEELDLLRRFGCDEVQGYLFARPSPAAAAYASAINAKVRP
ncbi:MAG TPA: EAL domain-containing protein, partial [Beijerinckiaceae bacterium]|nr:EAL domain-containing protein [Beijerinckiaceae bacterium]